MFLAGIELLDEVLGVFDGDLVRVAVKAEYYRNVILVLAFGPPTLKLKELDLLYRVKLNLLMSPYVS